MDSFGLSEIREFLGRTRFLAEVTCGMSQFGGIAWASECRAMASEKCIYSPLRCVVFREFVLRLCIISGLRHFFYPLYLLDRIS
jgi:hypothetical protein